MAEEVKFEYVDTKKAETCAVELCKGEINGARPVHHKIAAGDSVTFAANVGYYHILILLEGDAVYTTDGKEYSFNDRTTFVSDPKKDLVVKAAKEIKSDINARYEAFAKAEAYLIDHALVIPYGASPAGYVATKLNTFEVANTNTHPVI